MIARILVGDCRERMAEMEENSIDAIVTDPPYGLEFMGKEWDRIGTGRKGNPFDPKGQTFRVGGSIPLPPTPSHTRKRMPKCATCGKWKYNASKTSQCGCADPKWETDTWTYPQKAGAWHYEWAIEALRVAKPGAHLLAFGGTRTHHRLICAIEDAGWEIRDCLMFLHGTGFPKSLDVSKAIDRARDDTAAKWGVADFLRPHVERVGFATVTAAFGFGDETMTRARWTSHSQTNTPTWDQWQSLKVICGFGDEMDAEVWRLNGRKGKPGDDWNKREVIGHNDRPAGWFTTGDGHDITSAATDPARTWAGWGTALKPAWEPIVLARKPLTGTVAHNVQTHGTGALNIDSCRIASGPTAIMNAWEQEQYHCVSCVERAARSGKPEAPASRESTATKPVAPTSSARGSTRRTDTNRTDIGCSVGPSQGEPNIDPAVVSSLSIGASGNSTTARFGPVSSSTTSTRTSLIIESGTCSSCGAEITSGIIGQNSTGRWPSNLLLDKTSAALIDADNPEEIPSRYFYTAKASSADRNDGLEDGQRSTHPTVKPFDLMRWLVRLVTPPGGVVLDPFAGSGSTGVAALAESFNFIGIELSPEYAAIAERRIANVAPLLAQVEAEKPEPEPDAQLNLDITSSP